VIKVGILIHFFFSNFGVHILLLSTKSMAKLQNIRGQFKTIYLKDQVCICVSFLLQDHPIYAFFNFTSSDLTYFVVFYNLSIVFAAFEER